MQVTSVYEIPFESEFDWRVTAVQTMTDLAIQSISELMSKVDKNAIDFDWKDRYSSLLFVMKEGVFEKMCEDISQKAVKKLKDEF